MIVLILFFRSRKSLKRSLISNKSFLRSGTNTGSFYNNVSKSQTHEFGEVSGVLCLLRLLLSVLEVHQFAQEAVVAEAWLTAQEPFISSKELGGSVDEVEQLIRRHEAFRKAAATWEERFSSLRRLTTVFYQHYCSCEHTC